MKKFLRIIVFITILFTFNVKAAFVESYGIYGVNTVRVGEEFTLDFVIKVGGIVNSHESTLGISEVMFQVNFDKDDFLLTDFSSNYFNVAMYDKNIFIAEYAQSPNHCGYENLHCGDVTVTIKFYAKATSTYVKNISMSNVFVSLFDIKDPDKTYTIDDAIIIQDTRTASHLISIMQAEKEVSEPPKSATSSGTQQTITAPKIKSINNKLKSLEIENFSITFDKNQKSYKISSDENINSLKIKAVTDDTKATYEIVGAEDLKANDYKVLINVTAQSGAKTTYTIIVDTPEQHPVIENVYKEEEKFAFKLSKQNIIYLSVAISSILLILIIIFIVRKKKDREVEKYLNKL